MSPLSLGGGLSEDDPMGTLRVDHVGITVSDLPSATRFFERLGLVLDGPPTRIEGDFIDTVIGMAGACTEIVMLRAPDGGAAIELSCFVRPGAAPGTPTAMANVLGLRSVALEVDDLDDVVARLDVDEYHLVGGVGEHEATWRMAYVRGPDGILVALAQRMV